MGGHRGGLEGDPAYNHWQLFWRMRHLVAFSSTAAVVGALLLPTGPFVGINYFASKHTSIPWDEVRCDEDVRPEHCQAGILEFNAAFQAVIPFIPIVVLSTAPAMGAFSDVVGRRPALFLASATGCIACCSLLATAWFHTSIWLFILTYPLTDGGVLVAVVLSALCIDLLPDQQTRVLGLGLLTACNSAAAMLGSGIVLLLTLNQAVGLAALLWVALLAFVLVVPETLAAENHKPLAASNFMPVLSLRILWRTPLLRQLSLLLMLSGFADFGFSRVIGNIWAARMNWNAHDSQLRALVECMSSIVWMTFFFRPLLHTVGDMGALIVGRVAMLFLPVLMLYAATPSQVLVPELILSGPGTFILVVLGALKSSLVAENEQGTMQAALNTGYTLAATVGSVFNAAVYQHLARSSGDPPFRTVFVPINAVLAVATLVLTCLLFGPMRSLEAKNGASSPRKHSALLPGQGPTEVQPDAEAQPLSEPQTAYGSIKDGVQGR